METKELTCVECPMGCMISISIDKGEIKEIKGNTCPRGRMYAENEITCPMRVLTTTVKHKRGAMLSVKTDKPIKKENLFKAMEKASHIVAEGKIKIGDIIFKHFSDGANLIATDEIE